MEQPRQRPPASTLEATNLLVGVDDTDNLVSSGTGRLVQSLVGRLNDLGGVTALGATRHQLLVDPRIPYTSHNSSACIALRADPGAVEAVTALCAGFLETESAPGSDPGLAVATSAVWASGAARQALASYGRRAKAEVLDRGLAEDCALAIGVRLSSHGGDGGGVIGALAAVGLHLSGADGMFIWMPGIRKLRGRATYGQLRSLAPIDAACDADGVEPEQEDLIDLGEWVRPILHDGRAVLLVDDGRGAGLPDGLGAPRWALAPREVVKEH